MMIDQVDIYSRQVEGEAVREDQEKSGRGREKGAMCAMCPITRHNHPPPL